MVRSKGKSFLSTTEKEVLLGSKRDLEDTLKEKKISGIGTAAEQIDEGSIKREIDRIDRTLTDGALPKFSGSQKDAMVKEAKQLEETLAAGIPTREEMNHPAKNPGAVRKHMRWLDRNQSNIERYRTIQRIINPDDPQSVESLRKDK